MGIFETIAHVVLGITGEMEIRMSIRDYKNRSGVPDYEAHMVYRRKKEQRNHQKNTKNT